MSHVIFLNHDDKSDGVILSYDLSSGHGNVGMRWDLKKTKKKKKKKKELQSVFQSRVLLHPWIQLTLNWKQSKKEKIQEKLM